MKRHELSDQQWQLLTPLFPPRPRKRGGQWKDDRTVLNGVFGRLNTGAPWRDLPERYGQWKTVHDRFTKRRTSGLLDRPRGVVPDRHQDLLAFGRAAATQPAQEILLQKTASVELSTCSTITWAMSEYPDRAPSAVCPKGGKVRWPSHAWLLGRLGRPAAPGGARPANSSPTAELQDSLSRGPRGPRLNR